MNWIDQNFDAIINHIHQTNQHSDQLDIIEKLTAIKRDIMTNKDTAVIQYTRQFDRVTDPQFSLAVTPQEIKDAYKEIPDTFIQAIHHAQANLKRYYQHQIPQSWFVEETPGTQYGVQYSPIEKVGLYVPGGRAAYPSTVLMNAIPAQIAGVNQLIIATPPNSTGKISPAILVAADCCGIHQIYKVGGSQAVFALAYGTESIPKVDKIVGPGNIFVTLAKQMVYGIVDIDKPAGPSEVLIYIRNPQYIPFAAADFLAQLEHDPCAIAIAISENKSLLIDLKLEINRQMQESSRRSIIQESINNGYLFHSPDPQTSIRLINLCASEHLVLLLDDPGSVSSQIHTAGAIFLGPYSPVTMGDYYAGPNHVLPTSGAARFASPLGVMDFMKYSSLLSCSKDVLIQARNDIAILTQFEGFDAHQRAIDIRCDLTPPPIAL